MELKCQEAFLKFMAIVMKGYQNFLRDSTSNNSSAKQTAFQNFDDLFDMNEFIRSQKSSKQFYQEFCNTHSFAHFIHLRSHSSNQDNTNTIAHLDYNVFFDECIEKMANEQEDSKLLEVDKSLLVEHCQFIPPPEPSDPSLSYDYSGIFPKLDMKLFGSSNFCNSGSASANASVLSTPVHGRDFNKNGNNHTPTGKTPLWRTPAENKGAQRNAKILYDMTLKNRSNIVTSSGNNYPEGDLEGGVSVTKQWVKHLKMNCFTMWFMLLPANLSLKIEEVMFRYSLFIVILFHVRIFVIQCRLSLLCQNVVFSNLVSRLSNIPLNAWIVFTDFLVESAKAKCDTVLMKFVSGFRCTCSKCNSMKSVWNAKLLLFGSVIVHIIGCSVRVVNEKALGQNKLKSKNLGMGLV